MIDVVGIGSALMDFTVEADERLLERLGLKKGNMHLIDEERSREILGILSSHTMVKTPGGSAANTVAGVAAMGGKAVFMGTIGSDPFGELYREESEKTGLVTRLARHDRLTGFAITFITPDSERTFATHLGAALHFTRDNVIAGDIRGSKILHIEGYLLEPPDLRDACVHAMELARGAGARVSVDLADPSLVSRCLADLRDIVREYADIVCANEDEASSFTGQGGEEALNGLSRFAPLAVVKLGPQGSMLKAGGEVFRIPAYPVSVVNTNGAGDMYAAGLLFGISQGFPIDRAGRLGSYAASRVVAQVGARLGERLDIGQMGI